MVSTRGLWDNPAPMSCRRLAIITLLVGGFLCCASRGGAWEADFHRGLTEWLALQAGFRPEHARWIGLGDNHADDGIFDARYQVFWYACLGSEPTSSEMVRNLHFPTFASVPNPPDKRMVEPGGPPPRASSKIN
jgi:hypothetical protein